MNKFGYNQPIGGSISIVLAKTIHDVSKSSESIFIFETNQGAFVLFYKREDNIKFWTKQ